MSLQLSQAKEVLSGLMKEKALIMQKLEPRKAPPKLIRNTWHAQYLVITLN